MTAQMIILLWYRVIVVFPVRRWSSMLTFFLLIGSYKDNRRILINSNHYSTSMAIFFSSFACFFLIFAYIFFIYLLIFFSEVAGVIGWSFSAFGWFRCDFFTILLRWWSHCVLLLSEVDLLAVDYDLLAAHFGEIYIIYQLINKKGRG